MRMPNYSSLDVLSEQEDFRGQSAYKARQGSHLPQLQPGSKCRRPCLQVTQGDLLEQEDTSSCVAQRQYTSGGKTKELAVEATGCVT